MIKMEVEDIMLAVDTFLACAVETAKEHTVQIGDLIWLRMERRPGRGAAVRVRP